MQTLRCRNKGQLPDALCKSDISLSNMGSSALDDHAHGKKDSGKVKDRDTDMDYSFRHSSQILTLILVLRKQQQLRRRKEIR